MLRTLAQELADGDPHIDYFPSFEMVMLSDRQTAFREDFIHVRDPMVARIMSHFIMKYIEYPNGDNTDTNFALLAAASLRGKGNFEEAYKILRPVISTNVCDIEDVSEFMLSAIRLGKIQEAAEALTKADSAKNIGDDQEFDLTKAINVVVAAINDNRYEEATARLFLIVRQHLDSICHASDEMLYLVYSILGIIKAAEFLPLFSPSIYGALTDSHTSNADDIVCRKQINMVIKLNIREVDTECLRIVEECWNHHKRVLIMSSSADLRDALIRPLQTLGMFERAAFLEKIDELLEEPHS